jgi:dihydrofolate synthase/folylpolyglutamate synthase
MNYPETLAYLFSRLPMFQRIGAAAYKANLDNTIAIDSILNHPHRNFRTVHIAGTNGKGSTSHLLASIFQESGYKTGLYTSPHLIDFRERIKVNGEMIDESFIIDFVEKHKQAFEIIEPSFFEWTVGLAFDYFQHCKVDIAIIETGMGGRLDSTNIIKPELSIITNISFDHKQFLGDTLEKIAGEKAGIIKHETPVIIGETQPETARVFTKTANERNTSIEFADKIFRCEKILQNEKLIVDVFKNGERYINNLSCGLAGNYQLKNLATVLASAEFLQKKFERINENNIRNGIHKVITNTGLQGRWQIVSENPKVICDTAHNQASIEHIVEQLSEIEPSKIHFVLGFVSDKEVSEILSLFPKNAQYYFCEPSIPRAMKIETLKTFVGERFQNANYFDTVEAAYNYVTEKAQKDEVIYLGGSTFVVADFLTKHQDNRQ